VIECELDTVTVVNIDIDVQYTRVISVQFVSYQNR
jgi:hypothetical protein